jgi:prepilin peptidase CpaA
MPPLIEIAHWATIVLVCLTLATAGVCDVRFRQIPNWTVLAVALLFGAWFFVGSSIPLLSSLGAALLVFVCSFVLYSFGIVGAGDSKLATAVALFAGFPHLPEFILYMSLTGGVIVLCMLAADPARIFVAIQMRGRGFLERGVPYGVAIAVAGAMLVLAPAVQNLA